MRTYRLEDSSHYTPPENWNWRFTLMPNDGRPLYVISEQGRDIYWFEDRDEARAFCAGREAA